MKICEEAGTGIDKVITAVEAFQLPAPDFTAVLGSIQATLFAHQELHDMDSRERIRACYQHACLRRVSPKPMTNASLRIHFGIDTRNASKVSRLVNEALEAGAIKPFAPDQGKKYAKYLPFWA